MKATEENARYVRNNFAYASTSKVNGQIREWYRSPDNELYCIVSGARTGLKSIANFGKPRGQIRR